MDLDYWFEKLSCSNYTTCIRSDNLDLIEQTLSRIFQQEGCCRISQPPLPTNPVTAIKLLRSFSSHVELYLWAFGLFPGNLGWTVVKTSPINLLCHRASGSSRPWLSELAMQAGCDAFHYGVYRHWGVLLEANTAGQTLASGYLDCYDIKDMKFYDQPVTELSGRLQFLLLDVPEELLRATRATTIQYDENEIQQRKEDLTILIDQGGKQADFARAEWRELSMSYFERVYQALGQVLTDSSDYWYLNDLLQSAYAEPQQLKFSGVRLLYFQPGESDLNYQAGEIWEVISNEVASHYPEADNDDIPFMRPVYSRTTWANQLCDSWELEANRPWEGVKQFKL